MSAPAKKYYELSGCMTCNTKLTVFNPRLEPEFPRQTHSHAAHAGQGNARQDTRVLFLDVWRARAFLQPCKSTDALMGSSNFICARSSVPTKSPRSGVKPAVGSGKRISSVYECIMPLLQNRSCV